MNGGRLTKHDHQMFLSNPDPFCAYPTSNESKAIFSVLPPISLIDAAISSGQDSELVYGPNVNTDQDPSQISPPKNELNDVLAIDKVESSLPTEALNSPQLDTERHYITRSDEDDIKIQRTKAEVHDGEQDVILVLGVRTDYSDDASWKAIQQQLKQGLHGQSQELEFQTDLAFMNKTIEDICQTCPARYIVIADNETMENHTLKLINCLDKQTIIFRPKDFSIIMNQLPHSETTTESIQAHLNETEC